MQTDTKGPQLIRAIILANAFALPVYKGVATEGLVAFQTIDLTVVFVACAAVVMAFDYRDIMRRLSATRGAMVVLCGMAVVGVMMGVSVLWTSAPAYGLEKSVKFVVISIPFFLLSFAMVRSSGDVVAFSWVMLVIALVFAVSVLLFPSYQRAESGGFETRPTVLGSNSLNPAFQMAVAVSLSPVLIRRSSRLVSVSIYLVVLIIAVGLLTTGSRSMFAMAVGAWALAALIGGWRVVSRDAVVLTAISIAVGAIALSVATWEEGVSDSRSQARVLSTLGNPVAAVVESERYAMWRHCLLGPKSDLFFGRGVGSFAVDYFGVDSRFFPHNFVVEAIYELGIVGLLGVFAIVLGSLRASWLSRNIGSRFLFPPLFATSLTATLAVLFHWDLADSRLLFLLYGICIVPHRRLDCGGFDNALSIARFDASL